MCEMVIFWRVTLGKTARSRSYVRGQLSRSRTEVNIHGKPKGQRSKLKVKRSKWKLVADLLIDVIFWTFLNFGSIFRPRALDFGDNIYNKITRYCYVEYTCKVLESQLAGPLRYDENKKKIDSQIPKKCVKLSHFGNSEYYGNFSNFEILTVQ